MATEVHTLSVLIVAEDVRSGTHVESLMKQGGYTNTIVKDSGIEAMRYLQDHPVDFVMCDHAGKQISGWMFLREMKTNEKIRNLPAILYGSGPDPAPKEELNQYGVLQYLQMPCPPAKLHFLVASTLSLFKSSGTIEHKYTRAKEAQIKAEGETAVEIYEELRGLTKKSSRSSLGLAQSYVATGQEAKAEQVVMELAQAGDDSPASLFMQITLHIRKSNVVEAKAVADRMLAAGPEIPFNYSRIVKLFIENSCFKEAEPVCQEAMKRGFKLPEFAVGLAKCLYSGDQIDSALQTLEEAAKNFGQSDDMLNLKGVLFKKKNDFPSAISCYEEALKLSPMDPKVYFNLANCYIAMKDYPAAIGHLETCLKIAPTFARGREKLDEMKKRMAA